MSERPGWNPKSWKRRKNVDPSTAEGSPEPPAPGMLDPDFDFAEWASRNLPIDAPAPWTAEGDAEFGPQFPLPPEPSAGASPLPKPTPEQVRERVERARRFFNTGASHPVPDASAGEQSVPYPIPEDLRDWERRQREWEERNSADSDAPVPLPEVPVSTPVAPEEEEADLEMAPIPTRAEVNERVRQHYAAQGKEYTPPSQTRHERVQAARQSVERAVILPESREAAENAKQNVEQLLTMTEHSESMSGVAVPRNRGAQVLREVTEELRAEFGVADEPGLINRKLPDDKGESRAKPLRGIDSVKYQETVYPAEDGRLALVERWRIGKDGTPGELLWSSMGVIPGGAFEPALGGGRQPTKRLQEWLSRPDSMPMEWPTRQGESTEAFKQRQQLAADKMNYPKPFATPLRPGETVSDIGPGGGRRIADAEEAQEYALETNHEERQQGREWEDFQRKIDAEPDQAKKDELAAQRDAAAGEVQRRQVEDYRMPAQMRLDAVGTAEDVRAFAARGEQSWGAVDFTDPDAEEAALLRHNALHLDAVPFLEEKQGGLLHRKKNRGKKMVEGYFRADDNDHIVVLERRERESGALVSQTIITTKEPIRKRGKAELPPREVRKVRDEVRAEDRAKMVERETGRVARFLGGSARLRDFVNVGFGSGKNIDGGFDNAGGVYGDKYGDRDIAKRRAQMNKYKYGSNRRGGFLYWVTGGRV